LQSHGAGIAARTWLPRLSWLSRNALRALRTGWPLNALRALRTNWPLDTLQALNSLRALNALRSGFYAGGDSGLRDAVMSYDMTMMSRLAMMAGVTMTRPR
jgi:hypothetical protein